MFSPRFLGSFSFAFVLSVLTAACSGGGGGTPGGTGQSPGGSQTPGGNTPGGNTPGSGKTESSATCCVNKVYYKCSSASAAEKCGDLDNSDTSGCTRQTGECPSSPSPTPGGKDAGSGPTDPDDNTPAPSGGKFGDECKDDDACSSKVCITKGNATFGVCSKVCSFGTDCPIGYDCGDVGNASSKYCIPN